LHAQTHRHTDTQTHRHTDTHTHMQPLPISRANQLTTLREHHYPGAAPSYMSHANKVRTCRQRATRKSNACDLRNTQQHTATHSSTQQMGRTLVEDSSISSPGSCSTCHPHDTRVTHITHASCTRHTSNACATRSRVCRRIALSHTHTHTHTHTHKHKHTNTCSTCMLPAGAAAAAARKLHGKSARENATQG